MYARSESELYQDLNLNEEAVLALIRNHIQ